MPSDRIRVWWATLADPLLAGHDVIALVDPQASYTQVFEASGYRRRSPVEAVLSTSGFVGAKGTGLSVRELPCDVPIDLVRGFSAPREMKGRIVKRIERAMTGRLGGMWPVLASQVYFHGASQAFEHAWAEAGYPRIVVRHPSALTTGTRLDDGRPGSITSAARQDERVLALVAREVDDDEVSRDFVTDRQDV